MDEATQKTNALVAQAQQEIASERDRLVSELRNHVVDIALVLARQLFWLGVTLVGVAWLFRRGVARLEVGGG